MLVQDFINSVRYPLGDPQILTYSDPHILDALNTVLSVVNTALIKLNSNLPVKDATLSLPNGSADLPYDFISIKDVIYGGEDYYDYKIMGEKIYAPVDTLDIYYRHSYYYVSQDNHLPTPDYFVPLLKRLVIMIITNKMSAHDREFFEMVYSDLSAVISGREYAALEQPIPFII